IWNLVFIQYNRRGDGSLTPLPRKHVDTGMGLERLVAVLQGVRSNYDTDLFAPLIRRVEEISGMKYESEAAVAMRVIADHIRALAFAIADGVLPSNEGRGYVLRRLLRRAARYGRKLGFKEPFMCHLIPVLEEIMADDYPELVRHRSRILDVLQSEEESFANTLDRGIGLFEEVVSQVVGAGGSVFPGREAFRLYDTYGFPLDLTRLMAEERNLVVDEDEFGRCMEEQRERARAARGSAMREREKEVVSSLVEKALKSAFCGYETTETETSVVALADETGLVDRLPEGKEGEVLLAETPFYGESGGQVGDRGMIRSSAAEFEVWDTQKPAEGIILHLGKVVQGSLSVGDRVSAEVDAERRRRIARHHTATHLLNYALRKIVDPSVRQAGSLVGPDRFRFDFAHPRALSPAQLEEIERLVNDLVQADDEVRTYTMPLKDVPGSGIIAVFDEKYGETVRVLDIGGYSRELCGGTHVRRTGEIGIFKILTESSVAAGVRRIEAVCGRPAYEAMRREHEILMRLAKMLSVSMAELPRRVSALAEKVKSLEKQLRQRGGSQSEAAVRTRHHSVNGIDVLLGEAGETSADLLRGAADRIKARAEASVAVIAGVADGKALFVAWCSSEAVARGIHAGRLLGRIARIAGGGGGGRPEWAQAGGRNPEKIREALNAVPAAIAEMVAH
ncbi:MAG TPA: alanine--tRNA ligase, partial [Kiritimatiellae bacterium]|nr:alanine--tRNA ligase [Kiritimatiellia bacterium]